jgi:hypothetical protein
LRKVLGVVDQFAVHDRFVADVQDLGGGEGARQRCHLPVDDRADQVAVGELVAYPEVAHGGAGPPGHGPEHRLLAREWPVRSWADRGRVRAFAAAPADAGAPK